MRGALLKPLSIILVGAALLASPPHANAARPMFDFCNTWLPGQCQGWDQEDFAIAYGGLCPSWWAAVCDGDGHFMCIGEPS